MNQDFPHQLIIFGPPGTSKSYKARYEKTPILGIDAEEVIPVTFHAEFGYGDFVSRLLPLSEGNKVNYEVHAGPFIRALALACHRSEHSPADSPPRNVVLLIDEINRGNCAEIFGDIFQLLDRDDNGQSSYSVCASKLTVQALTDEIGKLADRDGKDSSELIERITEARMLRLPANLYLIGTMNTGDESIFFMDSAFKRRWNFEFSPAEFSAVPAVQANATIEGHPSVTWQKLIDALNAMIIEKCASPNLDDKMIGPGSSKRVWSVQRHRLRLWSRVMRHRLPYCAGLPQESQSSCRALTTVTHSIGNSANSATHATTKPARPWTRFRALTIPPNAS